MVTVLLAGASTAMPLAWMMLTAVLATAVAYGVLVRRLAGLSEAKPTSNAASQ
jgi:hypothetical protein